MTDSRLQCPIRLHKDTYKKVKAKVQKDQVTFQKLMEVLISAYLDDNKEVMKLVQKYADSKNKKRRRYELNEFEADALLREIETKYSPLKDLESAIEEIENE